MIVHLRANFYNFSAIFAKPGERGQRGPAAEPLTWTEGADKTDHPQPHAEIVFRPRYDAARREGDDFAILLNKDRRVGGLAPA